MRGQETRTTQAGDRRSPGQPPDLHDEGMLTLPSGIASISRDSPEGQPPDLHEEGMVTLPRSNIPRLS